MKNKRVIIATIIFILIISIIIIVLLELSKYSEYTCTIVEINDNKIIARAIQSKETYPISSDDKSFKSTSGNYINLQDLKVGDEIIIHEEANIPCVIEEINTNYINVVYSVYYSFSFENASIKGTDGNKITASDLKINDTIYVVNRKNKNDTIDLAHRYKDNSQLKYLYDVKLIKIIE